jgi:hypothetical protein
VVRVKRLVLSRKRSQKNTERIIATECLVSNETSNEETKCDNEVNHKENEPEDIPIGTISFNYDLLACASELGGLVSTLKFEISFVLSSGVSLTFAEYTGSS